MCYLDSWENNSFKRKSIFKDISIWQSIKCIFMKAYISNNCELPVEFFLIKYKLTKSGNLLFMWLPSFTRHYSCIIITQKNIHRLQKHVFAETNWKLTSSQEIFQNNRISTCMVSYCTLNCKNIITNSIW